MSNIKKGANSTLKTKLSLYSFYDFTLADNDLSYACSNGIDDTINCLVAHFDFTQISQYDDSMLEITEANGSMPIYSLATWTNNKTSHINTEYFGLTGYDNQTLQFTVPIYDDSDFSKDIVDTMFKESYLIVNKDNINYSNLQYKTEIKQSNIEKFTMFPIGGNLEEYDYRIDIEKDEIINKFNEDKDSYVASFKGGFYQGFYKLDGFDYQTLPNRYNEGFIITTWLYPSPSIADYERNPILNDKFIENENYEETNDGFFLYLGARAENKFWTELENCKDEDDNDIINFYANDNESDITITKDGEEVNIYNSMTDLREVDNQFLIMGRASKERNKDGLGIYQPYDFIEKDKISVVVDKLKPEFQYEENPFLLFGRSSGKKCCGEESDGLGRLTVCDIKKEESEETEPELDPKKHYLDIVDNCFGFRITRDGRVGYRYLTLDCEGNVEMVQRYSNQGIVENNTWTAVTLRWIPETYLNPNDPTIDCENADRRNGRLMVYVNCYLKHVFYDFPEFIGKRLNDLSEKQVGVPYNISLGGGSLGLLEHFTLNGQDCTDLGLNIEKYFTGTFLGKISQFKIYACDLTWCHIRNICVTEGNRYGLNNRDGYLVQENDQEIYDFYILLEDYGKIIITK